MGFASVLNYGEPICVLCNPCYEDYSIKTCDVGSEWEERVR